MTKPRALRPDEVVAILACYPRTGTLRRLEVAGGGTASVNFEVETTTGHYFLRRRNPRYTAEEAVAFDHCLLQYLAARGVPVVPACELPVQSDPRVGAVSRLWLRRGPDDVLELYPWREGRRFDPHSTAQLAAAGHALGMFHTATRGFGGPPGKEWPRYDHPHAIMEGLQRAGQLEGADSRRPQLSYLEEQAGQLAAALPDDRYAALPHTVIHGDYHPANVLFARDVVAGIFDLDWATRQPRLRDLADGILFFAARRATAIEGGDIASLTQTPWLDTERAATFLESYAGAAGWPLEQEEVLALPEFVRARWLFCRVDGMRKVPQARRLTFLLDGVIPPLDWLSTHQGPFDERSCVQARGAGPSGA